MPVSRCSSPRRAPRRPTAPLRFAKKFIANRAPVETAAIAHEAEVRQTRNSTVFAIEGKDKAGRRATFDVVVLNKSFLWVRGSAEELEKDGAVDPARRSGRRRAR